MNENKEEVLARKFPDAILESKPGQGGRRIRFVPSWAVIERLNLALGVGEWSWRIVSYQLEGETVSVAGELSALGCTYAGEDAHEVQQRQGTSVRTPDALANALKGASSGALVRAARLLGVGLYLYRGDSPGEAELAKPKGVDPQDIARMTDAFARFEITVAMLEKRIGGYLPRISLREFSNLRRIYHALKNGETTSADEFPVASDSAETTLEGAKQITRDKVEQIKKVAKKAGMNSGDLERIIKQQFEKKIDELTRFEATYLLSSLRRNNVEGAYPSEKDVPK